MTYDDAINRITTILTGTNQNSLSRDDVDTVIKNLLTTETTPNVQPTQKSIVCYHILCDGINILKQEIPITAAQQVTQATHLELKLKAIPNYTFDLSGLKFPISIA